MSEANSAPERRRPPHGPHGPHGLMPGEKAKDFKGSLAKLFRFMGRFKIALVVVLAFAIGSTVFSIIGPKVLSTATTELFEGIVAKVAGTGSIDFGAIGRILAATLGIYAVSAVCSFVQGWIMSTVTQRTCFELRNAISRKIDRVPFGYFERTSVGDTLSRITNDVDTLGQSLNQSLTQLVTSATTIVGVLVMMLTINVWMTLITLLIVPIAALVTVAVVKRSQRYFVEQQNTLGKINGQVEETFSGHVVVKAFGREREAVEAFCETNERLYSAGWRAQFVSGLMQPIMTFVSNLGYVAVAIAGSFFAVSGVITVGDIQAFIQYVKNFTQPITQLAQVSNVLQLMAAASERVFEFLEEPEQEPDASPAPRSENEGGAARAALPANESAAADDVAGAAPSADALGGAAEGEGAAAARCRLPVEFDHVRFGYDPDKPVIKDFTVRIEPGQTVALVGPTGAGKTTIVKLLMRFYDVQGGAIRIGGRDVRTMPRSEVRGLFGMVLQDTWLFNGTIRDNLRYGRLDATDEEVVAAAKAGCAHHFIKTLPGGYDFVISEDAGNISQGQRQLLTIARAILADHDMLILDEATSSVDTRTEERIQRAMDNLMRGRTSFVIAHRLSTIRAADLILVVNDGDIVEQGTHEELLAFGGFYADLYNSQFYDGIDE